MAGPVGPMWFDPAPSGYPWSVLMVPVNITNKGQAELLVDQIKEAGNNSMKQGNHYDALWKYNHALVLCRDHKLSSQRVSVISCNCAQACLHLKYYLDAFSHASDAIRADPHSPILHKAFFRRAEASRHLYQDMVRRNDPLLRIPGTARALDDSIRDYCDSFCLKNTFTTAICEAIVLAVDHSVPMGFEFLDGDINNGAPTKILTELLERLDTKHAHLHFLLHKIPFRTPNHYHFDCSSIEFTIVCKKSLGKKLLSTMFSYGMVISSQDVAKAVALLPDAKSATLDVIAAHCKGLPHESLSLAYEVADRLKKHQLLECLKKRGATPPVPHQEKAAEFKLEGNAYYHSGKYDEALARYYKALSLCQQHQLEEEEARIRGNCAQACLLLELYRDAFDHANECLRLDPDSAKGYYRRAEALMKMLESSKWSSRVPPGKTFTDVVVDYFQCHRMTENIKAIYQAMVVATNHDCTKSLPQLTDEELASGLATKILVELVQREDSQQKHFSALFFTLLPESCESGVDVSSLRVTDLLREKSITSAKLIQRLISLGMKVNESDVTSAVLVLMERHRKVLQLLAEECARTRKSTFTSACQEAIKAKKLEFVCCLIENGGAPDVEDLKDLTGWPRAKVDPVIDDYLRENTRPRKSKAPEPEEPHAGLPDRASALIAVRQTYATGEALRLGGKPEAASRKFQDALAVCIMYNFKEEVNEVCYSLAQLYLQHYKQYDAAYQLCTRALTETPTAKMHFLRATVLQQALSTPFVSVPRSIPSSNVMLDYCSCHRIEDNVKALTEAIIFATDNRLASILKDRKKEPLMSRRHVKSGFTTDLLLSLLKHEKVKETHVKVLLEIPIHRANPPHFDGSKVTVSLLIMKKITHTKILTTLFDCGMTAREPDMRLAIESLGGDSGTAAFEILCSHVQEDVSLDGICQVALKNKKVRFVLCLARKGCKLPCPSQEVLALALEKNLADVAESLLPFCTLPEVDLGGLMSTCKDIMNHHQLVVKMVDGGADPCGLGANKPLTEAVKMTNATKKLELVCALLEKGCDCNQLCGASEYSTTPVHVAVTIGVEAGGSTQVLDSVVASKTFCMETHDPFIDENGSTPLHLAVHNVKKEHSLNLLRALIETHKIPIDPFFRDKYGKRPADYISGKKDKRLPLLAVAASRVQHGEKGKKQKKKQRNGAKGAEKKEEGLANGNSTQNEEHSETKSDAMETEAPAPAPAPAPVPKPIKRLDSYDILSVNEKLDFHLKLVLGKGDGYFVTVVELPPEVIREVENGGASEESEFLAVPSSESSRGARKSLSPQPLSSDDGESEMNTVMSRYGLEDFDGLPWEVEVTNNVLKFFKNEKEHPYTLRLRAARTVYELAEGRRGKELSKELSNQSSNLFEAKLSKGGRIIWQIAIQFSPRRTGEHHNPIYAQVIRVWEIVPDHDQLSQTIRHTVKQIELSNERGQKASLNVPLIPQKEAKQKQQSVRQQERLEIPKIFTQADVEISGSEIERFIPAASPKEDEFNVTTFYSFSGAVLKSMLTGSNARRDFPFKEWPKEHEIINLPDTESILLLGRSGTGKTTCCLYRLWNEFKLYWDHPNVVMLPRQPLIALKLPKAREEEEKEAVESQDRDSGEAAVEDGAVAPSLSVSQPMHDIPPSLPKINCQVEEDEESPEEDDEEEDEYTSDESGDETSEGSESTEGSEETESTESSEASIEDDSQSEVEEVEEHLHQVFVTKNYVLCAQMKRRFYNMAAAHDFLDKHMDWESKDIPHSFAEIDDFAYPLFLTARQFYILLDNSIGDEQCFFRPRERDGSLRVKIVSSDYDHEDPDTLLDLEDSDSEGEMAPTARDHPVSFTSRQPTHKYVEVTALYFTERIWPEISRKCGARNLDPLLIWIEIQSFIKGSRLALLNGSALLLDEYRQIGNKMAPNFSNGRETIYKLYKRYDEYCQNKRHSVFLFDECDLVHDLHRRLRAVEDLPWSIHSLYIDEVQDFTQAELALYLHCCRHPNSLFFTGDTAQSIMRGIAFRFQDLRSSFHDIHRVVPQVKVPQQPHTLTINFRSHSGVLRLAGSIIDLLQMFFKGSIDHLPADSGMFTGPTPVVLASCEESDLALLLSSNRRESSRIEFGAHQVVLVQSKEAKEMLPSILKGAIVLTIFEAKGLEFDDVLLYNFFHDSMVDEKGWRVVTAYLEEHTECIQVNRRLPGSSTDPRSNRFDERHHKALNSELKYLYTAITRAKCNLWIYDSNVKRRLPMFDLWYKRDLVKVVGDNLTGVDSQHSLMFASISTAHQWKVQGDYFMKRSRWEQAKHCYDRAGPENVYLSVEANARFVVQQASKLAKPQLYLEAAVDFLRRDQLMHSVQCLLFAAQCLRRAKPQKFSSAAVMFERLEKYGEALKCYKKIKDTKNCIRLLEREKRYDEAVRMFRAPKEALAKAVEYTSKGIELSDELLPDNLSYVYASQCAKRKDKSTLIEMLGYMSDASRRARFLKICGLYTEALKEYDNNDELDNAYRLASGQCMFSEGREIARAHEDSKKEAEFVFHHIHTELLKSRGKGSPPFPSMRLETDMLPLKKAGDPMIKAQACLLWGIVTKDAGLCRTAHGTLLRFNKAAALEAFDALTSFSRDHEKPNVDHVLTACANAKDLEHALGTMSDMNQLVKQATAFYGLQKVRNVYLTPPNHNVWVTLKLKTQCLVKNDEEKDIDGWLRLNVPDTREALATHVGSYITKWLDAYGTETTIMRKIKGFKLHQEIQRHKSLLHHYTTKNEVSDLSLRLYMENLVRQCQLGSVLASQKTCDTALSTLLAIFSPQVSVHLPLNKQHVVLVRKATQIHKSFLAVVKAHLDPSNLNRIDEWFSAWWACCITDSSSSTLVDTVLEKLEDEVNHQSKNKSDPSVDTESCGSWRNDGKFQAPRAYVYWKQDNQYFHVFNFWLYSCTLIRNGKEPIWAAKQAIYHFLGTICQRRSLVISVTNLVHVLIIHCTGLFAMLTQLNHHQGKKSAKFVIPVTYPACVDQFDWLNSKDSKEIECTLFSACADKVKQSLRRGQPHISHNDCVKLLDTALSILLGTYRKDDTLPQKEQKNFSVLRYAFRTDKVLSSGAAQHCLVLALTLFANLMPYQSRYKTWESRKRELVSFFDEVSYREGLPDFVKDGRNVFQMTSQQMLQSKVIQYVGQLLSKVCAKGTPTQTFMMFSNKGKITYAPLPTGIAFQAGVSTTSQQLQQPAPKVASGPPPGLGQTDSTGKIWNLQSSSNREPPQGEGRQQQSQPAVTAAAPPARHTGATAPLTTPAPPDAHGVQEPQDPGNEGAQPPQRKWRNLPPVLDSLLHPPNTQTTFEQNEQPLAQTGWDYHLTDPRVYQQNNMQQTTYTALPQHTSMTSQVQFEQAMHQQQHSEPLTAPSLQPQSQTPWDPCYTQPYNPALGMVGPSYQQGGGGGKLPWPDFPMYTPQQAANLPGAYYPSLIQQHPHFDPYGALPSYSSTMPSNFDWDHLSHQQNQTEPGVPYGTPYTRAQSPYNTLPSAAVPLHIELASQLQENVTPPPSGAYVPSLTDSVSLPPPTTKDLPSQNGEAVQNSHQLESVPLSEVHGTNFKPLEKSQNLDAPRPTTTNAVFEDEQHDVIIDEGSVLFPEKVPVKKHSTTAFEDEQHDVIIDEGNVLFPEKVPVEEHSTTAFEDEQHDVIIDEGNVLFPEKVPVEEHSTTAFEDEQHDVIIDEGNVLFPEKVPVGEQEEGIVAEPPETEETLNDEDEEEEGGEFEEMDEDEKALGMSALRRSLRHDLPTVDPHLIDPSIVTEDFCNICGVPLMSRHAAEEREAGEEESLVEPYDSHVRGTGHARNYTLHKNFRESFEECYTVMVEELGALLHKCEHTQASSLTRLSDDIRDTLDETERKMAGHLANTSWRMGLALIDKATDEFQRLLSRGNKQYEKFKSENPWMTSNPGSRRDGVVDNTGGDSDTEFHDEINKTVREMEDDFTLTLRSETSKLESRTRKKVKKKKR